MREIYGRGYLLNKNEWCEQNLGWYYGGILHQTDFYGEKVDRWFIIDGTDTQDYDIGPEYEVVPESVGQYTGMKDIKEHRIFEGDIMETSIGGLTYHRGVVEFTDGSFGLRCTDGSAYFLCFVAGNYAIIGNVFENADLLEV